MFRETVIVIGVLTLTAAPSLCQQQAVKRSTSVARARVVAPPPSVSADDVAAIALATDLPVGLSRSERAQFRRVPERLRHKDRAAAQQDWQGALRSMRNRKAKPDVDGLVNWVLNQAYLEPIPDLKSRAEKVRYFNDQKEAAYRSRAELTALKAQLDAGRSARGRTFRPVRMGPEGAVIAQSARPATVESVASELQGIVVLCNKADANAKRANVSLQKAAQSQQQTLQTISNVSKMLHDTAKAIINNMKA